MILIGQYDSPFVRRVGITLLRYGLSFEHRNWSVWRDAEQIARYNPLRRVPTLLLDDGAVLTDTFAILDTLDEMVTPEIALLPRSGPERREGLRISALASGLADKAVSRLYEPLFRPDPSAVWLDRCKTQIEGTLGLMESERKARSTRYWLGSALSHADVAFACSFRLTREAHPELVTPGRYPALETEAARCEALPEFGAIYQPIKNAV